MLLRREFIGSALLFGLALSAPARAESPDWEAIVAAARGQTVYFNAWGGSDRINRYIEWAGEVVQARYGIELRQVKLADTAEAVSRLLAEKTARTTAGSIDLLWINGENFAAMKQHALLGPAFVQRLPNFALVDVAGKPTTVLDFNMPTAGLEAPWGMAQLVFLSDAARLPSPPRSLPQLLAWAHEHPGRFAYPQPPDFLGTTFLKQAALSLAEDPTVLGRPADAAAVAAVTEPLWRFLDELHPLLWRGGDGFPQSGPQLLNLLADGEIDLAMSFNPNEANAAIADGQLPPTVRSAGLDGGTIGNTHFLAIPFNASAAEGAMVVANFLLSAEAQARKQDIAVWGDPTVLALDRLSADDRRFFAALAEGPATVPPADLAHVLPEPDPSWVGLLEAEWQRRYLQ